MTLEVKKSDILNLFKDYNIDYKFMNFEKSETIKK